MPIAHDSLLHSRVETVLASEIADGDLKVGDQLPTEESLIARFGVSRIIRELVPEFSESRRKARPRREVPMSEQGARKREAPKEPVRPHQPGQAAFRAILSEEIEWKPFSVFPPEARLAALVGHPSEQGPYTLRVKVPHGVKLMPHWHPEDRIYTVISGSSTSAWATNSMSRSSWHTRPAR
jgi:DNA-binding transcriptional MocR family regulator